MNKLHCEVCRTDRPGTEPVYGLEVRFSSGENVTFPCVSALPGDVRALCDRLEGEDFDCASLRDVVRDYLTELHLNALASNGVA